MVATLLSNISIFASCFSLGSYSLQNNCSNATISIIFYQSSETMELIQYINYLASNTSGQENARNAIMNMYNHKMGMREHQILDIDRHNTRMNNLLVDLAASDAACGASTIICADPYCNTLCYSSCHMMVHQLLQLSRTFNSCSLSGARAHGTIGT
jgi:hypothetical protein